MADSSLLSSVRSYQNLEPPSNFVKFIHANRHIDLRPYQEEQHPSSSPIIRKNRSHNMFVSKGYSPSPIVPQKANAFHNRFYESIVQPSSSKNTAEFGYLQKDIVQLSSREIILTTENDLLKSQIKRLKQEIDYLREKSEDLQRKNQMLFTYKSRAQILDREYQILVQQYQKLKENEKGEQSNYIPSHIPVSFDQIGNTTPIYLDKRTKTSNFQGKLPKNKQIPSRVLSSQRQDLTGSKVSWKKVTSPSPIYKLQQRKQFSAYDELPLIESKIQSSEQDKRQGIDSPYLNRREETRTIDIKEFQKEKIKMYEKRVQEGEQEIIKLRKKNIELYTKCQQFEGQKLKYMQAITQLKYQKSKQLTDIKTKESTLQRQIDTLRLESEANHIKILQLNEEVNNDYSNFKFLKIEKEEIEAQLKSYQNQQKRLKMEQGQEQEYKINIINSQISQKHLKIEKELQSLQNQWALLTKKNNQNQIEKKLLQHELNQKKQAILNLQKQLLKVKQLSTNSQKQIDQLDQQSNPSQHLLPQLQSKQTQIKNLLHQLSFLQMQNNRFVQQRRQIQQQCMAFKHENRFLVDNCAKLTKIFELQKQQNIKLNELRQGWRMIEKRTRETMQVQTAINHLWQIKEVQYGNINAILEVITEKKNGMQIK